MSSTWRVMPTRSQGRSTSCKDVGGEEDGASLRLHLVHEAVELLGRSRVEAGMTMAGQYIRARRRPRGPIPWE